MKRLIAMLLGISLIVTVGLGCGGDTGKEKKEKDKTEKKDKEKKDASKVDN